MSIESAIEKIIQKGMAEGQFDDLKGKGKPLDLTDYFNMPEDMRMAFSLLQSNQFVPEEVELMNEIAEIRSEIAASTDPATIKSLNQKLNESSLSLRVAIERRKRS